MTIPSNSLRLYLGFLNRLEQVQVTAATNVIGSNLRVLGVVEGKEELRDLLEKTGIDHYVISSGDLTSGTFSSVAHAMTPAGIVDALDREFQKEDDILMRILECGSITEDEKHFSPRTSLTVCSACVKTEDGLATMKSWFSGQKS